MWEALSLLDDAPSRELAKRFGALPEEPQTEAWRVANRTALVSRIEGHEREVARAVADVVGSEDLAAAWPP
jgi:hypothetical protein